MLVFIGLELKISGNFGKNGQWGASKDANWIQLPIIATDADLYKGLKKIKLCLNALN